MFSDKLIRMLKKSGWAVFFTILILETLNLVIRMRSELYQYRLPFDISEGTVENCSDSTLANLVEGCAIVQLDTIFSIFKAPITSDSLATITKTPLKIKRSDRNINISVRSSGDEKDIREEWQEDIEDRVFDYIQGRTTVLLTVRNPETDNVYSHSVKTIRVLDENEIIQVSIAVLILLFTFFNSYLLLRYSQAKENILIVFFLLFLVSSAMSFLPVKAVANVWRCLISPFWGLFFYHYILVKTAGKSNIRKIYIRTAILYGIVFILSFFKIGELFKIIIYLYPVYWLLRAILLLRREYKSSQKIDYRRLLSAFKGITISGFGLGLILAGTLVAVTILPGTHWLLHSNLLNKILGIIIGLSIGGGSVIVLVGILWFFGSFTWSLLTGTALDIKIRSTLIYTIVGVLFVTVFGLIDYALGELLQYMFGKFVGSEFIAGIPGTIVLISLFVPIRTRVERIVDNKLNTSELDFLERADTFTQNLSEEGVVEGFEEYICENLIKRLPLEKVALISWDQEMDGYKFNEIRGSEVTENSRVADCKRILTGALVHDNHEKTIDDPQDISSFPLVIPIIYEDVHKWFLALGKKRDGSIYNKNDLSSLAKLVDKIKLSLKFILVYEDIVNGKYEQTIQEKDRLIREMQEKLDDLKIKRNP